MVTANIIVPIIEPTQWITLIMVVPKKNALLICLDPKDLNIAIQREPYPLPAKEVYMVPSYSQCLK